MSAGIQVMDAASNVLLDSSTTTVRFIEYVDVAAGASGSATDAKYSGCQVVSVGYNSTSMLITQPHVASISGTTLTWTAKGTTTSSRLIVFK